MIRIHFLNVGHGDCTIIEFPSGHMTMIDINNGKIIDEDSEKELQEYYKIDRVEYLLGKALGGNPLFEKGYDIELTDPVDYYKKKWGTSNIFRFICTHPDMDHISGLYRLHEQEKIPILNFWDSNHKFHEEDKDFEGTKYDKNDWDAYKKLRKMEDSPKAIFLERNAKGDFYTGDGIYLLSPTAELVKLAHEKEDPNHLSHVLMIVHGKSKILLGGDATTEVWDDIVKNFSKDFLHCGVLKAAHHGRESGYNEEAIKTINPLITIVSVGKKPDTDASNKYRNYSKYVWSTRWNGNIVLECHEDGRITYDKQYDR